jgi:hypothetical protein
VASLVDKANANSNAINIYICFHWLMFAVKSTVDMSLLS